MVGTPLTEHPFEIAEYRGRQFRVEFNAEILAKKFFYRGDRAKARDIFDLCAVAQVDPEGIVRAQPFMQRHGAKFLQTLGAREDLLRHEFEAIDAQGFQDPFEPCAELARRVVQSALDTSTAGSPNGRR